MNFSLKRRVQYFKIFFRLSLMSDFSFIKMHSNNISIDPPNSVFPHTNITDVIQIMKKLYLKTVKIKINFT